MANAFNTQVINEGVRNFTVNLTGTLDSSDQPVTTVISPANCTYYIPKGFRINCINFTISDPLVVSLWWAGMTDILILPMAGRNKVDFDGGMFNTAYMPTGAIRISTSGYVSGIQTYSILIDMVKLNVDNRI